MFDNLPTLESLPDPANKNVLVRADFNVPLDSNGNIEDDMRIRAVLPTIEFLIENGANVTVCSHLGRPKGKPDERYSMEPVRKRLDELTSKPVRLLENLRFDAGEETNDPDSVKALVDGQDLYVNDAFGAAHRAHASIVGPPQFLPSAAGKLLEREVEVLGGLLRNPARPFVAVLGGSKVSDKLGVIEALMDKVDCLVIGGGMCFTFLVAMGHEVGGSLLEKDQVEMCRKLLDTGKRILIPTDIKIVEPDGDEVRTVGRDVPDGWRGLDIGPESATTFAGEVSKSATTLWNGPMGVFEDDRFADGTRSVADAMAKAEGFTVVGGGDSASALAKFGLAANIDHISTGGGASLEFIEQGDLPGLAALRASAAARNSDSGN